MNRTRKTLSRRKGRLYAILSDIHANFPALQAVEQDVRRLAQQKGLPAPIFVCLGDVVDYGPHPNLCMDWVRRYVSMVVRGNHDDEMHKVLYRRPHPNIREDWWPILLWTRRKLKLEHKKVIASWSAVLRSPNGLQPFTLFHGSLKGNGDRIADVGNAEWNFEQLRTHFGLFGHTHYQGCFQEAQGNLIKLHLVEPDQLGKWYRMPWRRTLFNPGSVGQPRQHSVQHNYPDYRAAYLLIHMVRDEAERYQFRRVEYDCLKTVNDLAQIHWEPNGSKATNGSDILREGQGNQLPDDYIQRLPELLSELVRSEGPLIRQLACKQMDS